MIGALVYTAGKRIVFFPGGKNRTPIPSPGVIKRATPGAADLYASALIDHFSLDENRRTWHIKLLGRPIRFPTQQTLPIDQHLSLWCQWQLRSLDELEPVPEIMEILIKPSDHVRDLQTILPMIVQSREPTISVLRLPADPDLDTFWGFQFLVSNTADRSLPNLLPTQINRPPHVTVNVRRPPHPGKKMQIPLEGMEGCVWIRCYKISGRWNLQAL
jgi:hypothetical protein